MRRTHPVGSLWFFSIIILSMVLNASLAASQANEQSNEFDFSLSAAPIFFAATDLDRGAKFSLRQYQLRGVATRSFSDSTRLGFSFGYDHLDFDFSGITAFGGPEPWRKVHRIGLGLPVFYRAGDSWQFMVSPSLDFSGESGADFNEALRYGAVVSATHRFNPAFSLGAGIGIFHGLEETNVFPYLAVHLKINEKWVLTNPFSAGPIGPAGLELTYFPSDFWEIGGGGAYRSSRFRLDNHGIAPGGIGQSSGLPAWLRITRKFSRHLKLDLYGGVLLDGELRIEDRDGRKLGSDDFDPAAFMAVNFSARF